MAAIDFNLIQKSAEDLVKNASAKLLPIDLDKVAKYLNIDVHYEELDDDVSGFLLVEDGIATIVINQNQHENRQRFTIAHEIGHFLHHVDKGDGLFVDKKYSIHHRDSRSATGNYKKEREANFFAANLLMPEKLIRKEVSSREIDFIDDTEAYLLARKFGVSEQALGFRLARLEYEVGQDD